jgi:hypothetical protein
MKIETIKYLSKDDPLEPQVYNCSSNYSSNCADSFGSCKNLPNIRIDIKNQTFLAEVKSKDRVVLIDQSYRYYGEKYEFFRMSRYYEWKCRRLEEKNREESEKGFFYPEKIYRLSMSMDRIINMAYKHRTKKN